MKVWLFKILFGTLADFVQVWWEDIRAQMADNALVWHRVELTMKDYMNSGLSDEQKRNAARDAAIAYFKELGTDVSKSLANSIAEVVLRRAKKYAAPAARSPISIAKLIPAAVLVFLLISCGGDGGEGEGADIADAIGIPTGGCSGGNVNVTGGGNVSGTITGGCNTIPEEEDDEEDDDEGEDDPLVPGEGPLTPFQTPTPLGFQPPGFQ